MSDIAPSFAQAVCRVDDDKMKLLGDFESTTTVATMFLMWLTELRDEWPESTRKRKWVRWEEASHEASGIKSMWLPVIEAARHALSKSAP